MSTWSVVFWLLVSACFGVGDILTVEDSVVHPSGVVVPISSTVVAQHPAVITAPAAPIVSDTVTVEDSVIHPSGAVVPVASTAVAHTAPVIATPVAPIVSDTVTVEDSVVHPSGAVVPVASSVVAHSAPVIAAPIAPIVADTVTVEDSVVHPSGAVVPVASTVVAQTTPVIATPVATPIVSDETVVEDSVGVGAAGMESVSVDDSIVTPLGEIPAGHFSDSVSATEGIIAKRSWNLIKVIANRRTMLEDLNATQANFTFPETIVYFNPSAIKSATIVKPFYKTGNLSISAYPLLNANTSVIPVLLFAHVKTNESGFANFSRHQHAAKKPEITLASRENPDIHEIVRQHATPRNLSSTSSATSEYKNSFNQLKNKPVLSTTDEEPPVTSEKLELAARLFALSPNRTLWANTTDERDKPAVFTGRERFL